MTCRRPYALLTLCVATVACGGDAANDRPAAAKLAEARLGEFRRDADLITRFVDSALVLSQENDPLHRAEHCNTLANLLTREIEAAAAKRRTSRASELGQMLQAVLVDGVADNLRQARTDDLPPETTRAKDIVRLGEASTRILTDVQRFVDMMLPQEQAAMQGMIQAVNNASEHVRKSSQGTGSPGLDGKNHKNGKKSKKS